MNSVGHARPKAEGFPLAPLIEALVDVRFAEPLTVEEVERTRDALAEFYPTFTPIPFHNVHVDATAGSVEIADGEVHYRGQGGDNSEIALLRPDGFLSSQLAPYRDWSELYSRFKRDLDRAFEAIGQRALSRMAVRSINRIDVPGTDGIYRYEDYLMVYPHLPEGFDLITDFQVQVLKEFPEIGAAARIVVRGHPETVENKASFVLDVDLFRGSNVPDVGSALDELFAEFRRVKNDIYQTCLTPLALKEFE